MYDADIDLIAGVLLTSMLLAIEPGFRLGIRRTTRRARRGLIEVDQRSLTDLQAMMRAEAPAGGASPAGGPWR